MIKKFNLKFENLSFTKLQKNINETCYKLIKLSSTWNEEKINNFFKPLIKGNVKYTKSLNFLLIFIISPYFEELYSDRA